MVRTLSWIGLLALAACVFVDDTAPRKAIVVLEGDPDTEVRVVLSTEFFTSVLASDRTRVDLSRADTLLRTLPFDTAYALEPALRFFAEGAARQTDLQSFRMRVLLDGEVSFDVSGPLTKGAPRRFLYSFSELVTSDMFVRQR